MTARRRIIRLAFVGVVVVAAGIDVYAAGLATARTFGSAAVTASPSPTVTIAPTPEPTPTPTASPTATPSPTPLPTPTPTPVPTAVEHPVAAGTEPSVAADPFHPGTVAVAVENVTWVGSNGCSRPAVRVSTDSGATWGAASYPWSGCEGIHAVLAWGPDSRLWAGNSMGVGSGVQMSMSHSDDLGRSWSKPYVEHFTPPWVGCFPSIGVDTWPGSPNFGTVYVAYNWLPDKFGPGVSVLASRDGSSWVHGEVPLGPSPAGYPYAWRIGYRVKAAPDGTAYVSFYESNLKKWSAANLFNEGAGTNIGLRTFRTARIHFDGKTVKADSSVVATRVSSWDSQFQSGLAVDDAGQAWLAVEESGKIQVGKIGGAGQFLSVTGKTSFKPSLAISGSTIFVGWHATDKKKLNWTYYTVSYDSGKTFLPPMPVTSTAWPSSAANVMNGVGLREEAGVSGGVFYYAYGDARHGLAAYLAVVEPQTGSPASAAR